MENLLVWGRDGNTTRKRNPVVTIQHQKIASGGPAGGQTFEKFDKQILSNFLKAFAKVLALRNEGRGPSQPGVQGIIPWPPEARFLNRL